MRLSVLMPVHNGLPYLNATLAQLVPQLGEHDELVALDDGSTDGSGASLEALAGQAAAGGRPRVTVLRHEQPRGVAAARNRLLAQASGTIIWFMDADDLLEPDGVALVMSAFEADPGLDAVLIDYAVLRQSPSLKHRLRGEHHRRTFAGPSGVIGSADDLMAGLWAAGQWHLWSKVLRRSVWPEELRFKPGRVFEDLALTPRAMAGCRRALYLDRPLMHYRSHGASILGTMTPLKVRDWLDAWLELAPWLALQEVHSRAGCAGRDALGKDLNRIHRLWQRMALPTSDWLDALALLDHTLPGLMAHWTRPAWDPRRWLWAGGVRRAGWGQAQGRRVASEAAASEQHRA